MACKGLTFDFDQHCTKVQGLRWCLSISGIKEFDLYTAQLAQRVHTKGVRPDSISVTATANMLPFDNLKPAEWLGAGPAVEY